MISWIFGQIEIHDFLHIKEAQGIYIFSVLDGVSFNTGGYFRLKYLGKLVKHERVSLYCIRPSHIRTRKWYTLPEITRDASYCCPLVILVLLWETCTLCEDR
jgi:hypothetical protein